MSLMYSICRGSVIGPSSPCAIASENPIMALAQLGGPRQRRSDNRAALLGGVGRRPPRAHLLLQPGQATLVGAFEPETHRGAAQAHPGRDPRRTQAVNRVLDDPRTADQPRAEFL